jgi:hypothetical protein
MRHRAWDAILRAANGAAPGWPRGALSDSQNGRDCGMPVDPQESPATFMLQENPIPAF